jgi:hypothetical protein
MDLTTWPHLLEVGSQVVHGGAVDGVEVGDMQIQAVDPSRSLVASRARAKSM